VQCQQCGLAGQLSMMVTLRSVGTCKSAGSGPSTSCYGWHTTAVGSAQTQQRAVTELQQSNPSRVAIVCHVYTTTLSQTVGLK
jgi:hypothetical protein